MSPPERLGGVLLFRIRQVPTWVWATGGFVELIEQAALTGLQPGRVAWTRDGEPSRAIYEAGEENT